MTPPSSTLTRDQKVLVIAPDPFLGALIGVVVENSRLRPVFPQPDERPDAALDREKPLVAIVVEATTRAAESDLFIKRARNRSVRVLLFGSAPAVAGRRSMGNGSAADVFCFPEDFPRFEAVLGELAKGS